MDNIRVLQGLQNAVNRAYDKSPSRAEHTAVNHKRKKACERDRTTLRKFEYTRVRESKRKCNRNCAVHDRASVAHLAFVAYKPHHDHYRHKHYCGHNHTDEICVWIILRNVAVVLRHKHHCGNKTTKHRHRRDYKGNFDRFIVEKRAYEHCNRACYDGYERCENGIEKFCLHIVDVALKFDVSNHDNHSYRKARNYTDGVFFEVGKLLFFEMPYEKSYGDKRRNDCHGKIECDVLQFVTQSLDIHKKSPPKTLLWGT